MRRAVLGLLFLAACGTPQERCIARESRDLRTIDRLIVESEGNLKRGYALTEVVIYRDRWVPCLVVAPPPSVQDEPAPPATPLLCRDSQRDTEIRPKAIDLNAEARKLDSMREKRVSLAKAAQQAIAACQAAFPE